MERVDTRCGERKFGALAKPKLASDRLSACLLSHQKAVRRKQNMLRHLLLLACATSAVATTTCTAAASAYIGSTIAGIAWVDQVQKCGGEYGASDYASNDCHLVQQQAELGGFDCCSGGGGWVSSATFGLEPLLAACKATISSSSSSRATASTSRRSAAAASRLDRVPES